MKEFVWIPSKGKRLAAMIHLPQSFQAVTPLVVCCHGFTGDKVGYNQLTRNLAEYLETQGYGVLRFDYLGSGDSDGLFAEETSVAGWREDLNHVLRWVSEQPQFSASPIILYGHSLGGLVALLHQDLFKRVVGRMFFAPVTQPISNFRDIIFGPDLWQKALKGDVIANFFDKGFRLESQFVADLVTENYNTLKDVQSLSTPLLFIHGSNDAVVPIEGTRRVYAEYQHEKEFCELPIDHSAIGGQDILYAALGKWIKEKFPLL